MSLLLSVPFSYSHQRKSSFLLQLFNMLFVIQVICFAQTGVYTQSGGSATQSGQTYAATQADQSSVLVISSGNVTLQNCTLTKTGNASDVNAASQYGTNAGVLAKSAGSVTITGGTVTTNASGANGLFATGAGSIVTMAGGSIQANGASAHGVDATYTGTIVLTNVDVSTSGSNSSAIATDFGGGTVTVNGGTIIASATASGTHSAGIYSTGIITVKNATVTSSGDCGGVIDGANSIILNNTVLTGKVEGIKTWKTAPASGAATVTIVGGKLISTEGDAFYVTGETGNAANATITISGGAVINAGSGNLVNMVSSGTATFSVDGTPLTGNIITTGTGGTVNTVLKNGASLTGKINTSGLVLDAASAWTLTANSNVTYIVNPAIVSGSTITNIIGNGFSVHYDASQTQNSYLQGKIYSLANGGFLTPNAVSVTEPAVLKVNSCSLEQNYPNPFNPSTTFLFTLPQSGYASIKVFDIRGAIVATVTEGYMQAGAHTVTWNAGAANGTSIPSGIYFYILRYNDQQVVKKLTLLK